jgi:aromatic ring-cleaving dioxygenase
MADPAQPFHAHVYYGAAERAAAELLRVALLSKGEALFVGRLTDGPVGPHPIPQFEVHFDKSALAALMPQFEQSGLRVLVHPLTDDDQADHTSLGRWIGKRVDLDLSVLDPPGMNQGAARFGKSDF